MKSPLSHPFINTQVWTLSDKEPFAKGGKRAVYLSPDNPETCVKVNLADQLPHDLWKKLPFMRRIRKSIDDMNENCNDWQIIEKLAARRDETIWRHIPKCHGWALTDMGPGLVVDLIRDADGLISRSLLAYLWECGLEEAVEQAVEELISFWSSTRVPSRSLGLHNIVARRLDDQQLCLVVIDGFGSTQWLPLPILSSLYAKRRALRIRTDIHSLLARKERNLDPGNYGFLLRRS
jgi:hypothetical protein